MKLGRLWSKLIKVHSFNLLTASISSCKPGTFSSILTAVYQFYSCYHLDTNHGNLLREITCTYIRRTITSCWAWQPCESSVVPQRKKVPKLKLIKTRIFSRVALNATGMFVKRTTFMSYATEWNRKRYKEMTSETRRTLMTLTERYWNMLVRSNIILETSRKSRLWNVFNYLQITGSAFSQHCSNISNKFLKSISIWNILLFLFKNTDVWET